MATVPPRAALLSASAVPIAGNLRRIRSEKRALWELLGVPERRNRQGNPEYPANDSAGTVLLDLQLHRDELHRRNPHQEQATNAQLREIAETMQLPDNLPGRETYFPYLRAFQSHP